METKRIEDYFNKTRQLPLAMSFAEVKSLVSLKGVTSPPKKSWWNLNNIIIMSTSIILITATALFMNSSPTRSNYEPVSRTFKTTTELNAPLDESVSYFVGLPANEAKRQVETATLLENQISTKGLSKINKDQPIKPVSSKIQAIDDKQQVAALEEPEVPEEPVEPIVGEEESLESNLGGDFEGEEKLITKKISADNISSLYLSHSNGDINIATWDKNEIEVTATFTLKAADSEAIKKGLEDFDIDLSVMGSKLTVKSNWDELNNCNCGPNKTTEPKGLKKLFYFPSKNKAKTDDGKSFEYENFKIEYTVKIPKKLNLDLSNKFADILVSDVDGNLSVNLFRGALRAKGVSNNIDLNIKYGSAEVGNFLEADISLFRSDSKIGASNRVNLKANYSTVEYAGGKELKLTAFRSDFTSLGAIDKVEGSFKYGQLKLKDRVVDANLEMFRAEMTGTTFELLNLDASYSELSATKVNQFELKNAFRCDFKIEEVRKIEGNLKYTPVNIGILTELADINAFRGEIKIDQVKADFKQLNFETKYTDIDLNFNPDSKYELDAQTTYSDFKVPKEVTDINLQNGSHNHTNHFVGTVNKGSNKTASKVFVNSFQGVIRLN